MPTRKQRRRDAKLRRHEYEEVYVDAEGREVSVDEVEPQRPVRAAKGGSASKTSRNGAAPRDARGRAIRAVPPPSWQRSLRRWVIFGPLFALIVIFTSKSGSRVGASLYAAAYGLALLPFMYLLDRMTYRLYLRRVGGAESQPPRKRAAK
jgi:hypothetical protein